MPLKQIKASANRRFLVTADDEPFFWLADTAWELFHRLNRREAERYLETRRQQGFNVIQAVILADLDGLHTPNANGHTPLLGDDPTRPNEYYFRDVDEIVRMAAEKGLYVGLLPTWGDKVHTGLWGVGPAIFNVANARAYGEYLGQRYRSDTNILWILGGDRPATGYEELWAGMAEGIIEGLGYRPFFTYHPLAGPSSGAWLHREEWLDMNMLQSGHDFLDMPTWEMISIDYERRPVKPVLDAEPNYEDHPVDSFRQEWQIEFGRFTDYDVRKQAYRAVFSGACGHTYGHHSVWQMWSWGRERENFPMPPWEEAILRPGATQMIHLKNLMLSRPYLSRIPAPEMLPGISKIPSPHKEQRFDPLRASFPVATRCAEGTYGLVYFPLAEQSLEVDLRPLGEHAEAAWFDPRNGKYFPAGECSGEVVLFTSPIAGPDWVLVLDSVQA